MWALGVYWSFVNAEWRGREFHLLNEIGLALPFLVTFSILFILPLFPRLKYLEGNNIERPTFKHSISSVIDVPENFDFNRLKTEIAEKWLITSSDHLRSVLKFRDKWGFSKNWGAGAWMKYDNDTKKLYLECFSISRWQNLTGEAQKMQKEIEDCLELQDLFALTLARDGNIAP